MREYKILNPLTLSDKGSYDRYIDQIMSKEDFFVSFSSRGEKTTSTRESLKELDKFYDQMPNGDLRLITYTKQTER